MTWICLLGPSPLGAHAVVSEGHRLVVVASPGSVIPPPVSSLAEMVLFADIGDAARVAAALESLVGRDGPPALVLSFTEPGLAAAADLATGYGLPTVSPGAVRATRDKSLMRAALADTPLAWPHHAGDGPEIAAWLASRPAGTAWVVKPVDGTGSEGVHAVRTPFTSADAGWAGAGGRWITERKADGPEFSVEAVSAGGRHRLLGITAKRTTDWPRFVETGHVAPAPLDPAATEAIWTATRVLLDAVGVQDGPTHTELRLDPVHGPVIMETHTRPGGDCIPELVALTTGRDQYRETVAALLGRPAPAGAVTSAAAAIRFVLPAGPGRLMSVSVEDRAVSGPGLHRLEIDRCAGAEVSEVRSSDDRIGYVLTLGADTTTAERRAVDAAGAVHLTIRQEEPCPVS